MAAVELALAALLQHQLCPLSQRMVDLYASLEQNPGMRHVLLAGDVKIGVAALHDFTPDKTPASARLKIGLPFYCHDIGDEPSLCGRLLAGICIKAAFFLSADLSRGFALWSPPLSSRGSWPPPQAFSHACQAI